jgi:hypothetical protein
MILPRHRGQTFRKSVGGENFLLPPRFGKGGQAHAEFRRIVTRQPAPPIVVVRQASAVVQVRE